MKRVVSLILTATFTVTAITGIMMFFRELRVVSHLHEILAVTFVIAAVFHIILNVECLGTYIKQRPVLSVIIAAVTLAAVAILIIASPHRHHQRQFRYGPNLSDIKKQGLH